jgi:hypothetical protein
MQDNLYQPPQSSTGLPGNFTTHKFSLDKALEEAWNSIKTQIGVSIGFTLVAMLLIVLAIISCVGIIFVVPHLSVGLVLMGLAICRKNLELGQLWKGFSAYGDVLFEFLLLALVGLLVSVPFYIPGIFAFISQMPPVEQLETMEPEEIVTLYEQTAGVWNALTYLSWPISMYIQSRVLLAYPLIVERKVPAIQAIKISIAATKDQQWLIFGTQFLVGALSGFGILFCCVGILFTMPFGYAILGSVIRQIWGETDTPGENQSSLPQS